MIDLRKHTFSWSSLGRRLSANEGTLTRSLNFVRGVSSEGFGRIRHDTMIRGLLDTDRHIRRFFDGETPSVPAFYSDKVRHDLGPLWNALPAGAMEHDPNAYLKSQATAAVPALTV